MDAGQKVVMITIKVSHPGLNFLNKNTKPKMDCLLKSKEDIKG
jgi:hypothetical protein